MQFPDLAAFTTLNLYPLLWALILGGAVGLEREWNGRPAGLRTHVLVCISSTMLIMMSQVVGKEMLLGEEGRLVLDPNRMGAGIVTGIGFLGAATVLRSGDALRGLTTAACIWYVAGLGIVLGNDHYALGIIATLIVLFVLTVLNRLTGFIDPVIYRRLIVMHAHEDAKQLVDKINVILRKEGCRVLDLASGHDRVHDSHELVFYVSLKNDLQSPRVTGGVVALPGVNSARWKLISNPH